MQNTVSKGNSFCIVFNSAICRLTFLHILGDVVFEIQFVINCYNKNFHCDCVGYGNLRLVTLTNSVPLFFPSTIAWYFELFLVIPFCANHLSALPRSLLIEEARASLLASAHCSHFQALPIINTQRRRE